MITATITAGILGIIATYASEIFSWVNKKVDGTPLKGDGAYLTAGAVAFVVALFQTLVLPLIPAHFIASLTATGGIVFATSQVWYRFFNDKFGLTVQADPVQGNIAG